MERHIARFMKMLHENLKDEYWTIDHFMTELPSKWEYSVYAHNENQHILGYAIVSEKQDSLHIHKLVVDQRVQSQGIGAAMINRLVASTDKRITLKVNTENSRAISFYKKNQFSISTQTDTSYTMTRFRLL
jgi:ribosomal protein S18 acetylase RimI-like enzyme